MSSKAYFALKRGVEGLWAPLDEHLLNKVFRMFSSNLSLTALLVSKEPAKSPFVTLSSRLNAVHAHLSDSRFIKIGSPILRSMEASISMYKSMFSSFLATPVQIAQSKYQSRLFDGERLKTNKKEVIVDSCNFVECRLMNEESGSAILCQNPKASLTILDSKFVKCQSNSDGGAVYAVVGSSSVSGSCFFLCRALKNAQACYLEASESLNVNTSTVFMCGTQKNMSSSLLTLSADDVSFKRSNISDNEPLGILGGVKMEAFKQCHVEFSQFFRNNGPGLFDLKGERGHFSIALSNLFMNHCHGLHMFILKDTKASFNDVTFHMNSVKEIIKTSESDTANMIHCTADFFSNVLGDEDQIFTMDCEFDQRRLTYVAIPSVSIDICNSILEDTPSKKFVVYDEVRTAALSTPVATKAPEKREEPKPTKILLKTAKPFSRATVLLPFVACVLVAIGAVVVCVKEANI